MEDSNCPPVAMSSTASQQYLVDTAEQSNSNSNQNSMSELKKITAKEWLTVVILCFVNLINYMDRFTVAGVLSHIKKEFDMSNSESGLLQTAFIISYMFCAPLFGYLGDRYNRKLIMCFGVFLWCLTTFVGSFMKTYGWFLFFRALVGIGEASYSTIAPTIISDLFVKNVRSKMLALFYFAIPVGSGLGYIIGGTTYDITGYWQWGLRVTPFLGIIAIILMQAFISDPSRGEKEGGANINTTSWSDDLKALTVNRSFMLSTAGFTCISFVTGALAWWGPTFIKSGLILQHKDKSGELEEVSYKFGVIAMMAGLIGVPFGSALSQKLKERSQQADPLICAFGLLVSAPLVFFGALFASSDSVLCYAFIFIGQIALNLNWSIVADMLLYVVLPTRRSTAEALQILFAHALGDAGSPYLIGLISDALKTTMLPNMTIGWVEPEKNSLQNDGHDQIAEFRSLQYSLFITIFILILGSIFFFLTALYIEKDKAMVELTIADALENDVSHASDDELDPTVITRPDHG